MKTQLVDVPLCFPFPVVSILRLRGVLSKFRGMAILRTIACDSQDVDGRLFFVVEWVDHFQEPRETQTIK